MMKPVRTALAAALVLAAAPAFAAGDPYSQTVFIGDSLTDSGHFRPALIQAVGPNGALIGRFTTNPGLVWSEWLADYYGTNATSDNQGGTNYAVGGARTGTNTSGALGTIPSLATQTANYLAANGGRADPNALYTVWGGANDLFAVAAGAPAQSTITNAVTAQIGVIGALRNAGAEYILVPTVPDLGVTPQFRAGGPAQQAAGTQLASTYNTALYGGIASAGLRVIPLDTFNLLREITSNPNPYGIGNVTGTACNPQITGSSLTCSPTNTVPGGADTYAFADGVHPSSKSHRILADYALSVLEGPRFIAVLPNSASTVGRARADQVANHVGERSDGEGMRWWGNVRGDFQRYGHGDLYDGAGPALTGGVDWTRGNLVFGAFLGYGQQKQDFGLRNGEFEQKDTSIGGFIGWYGQHAWVNGQLSYTKLDFDIDRNANLGAVTRVHHGSADGKNVTAALNAGWEFGETLRHGPVIGILSQRIDVDGFAESEPTLSTSLAYPDQSFDSLIGSIGWQVNYAYSEGFRPYARLTIDREFEDAPKNAYARLQTVPGLGYYAVKGREFDQDYGTLLLGARTKLFGLDANLGASVTVGQGAGNNTTVFAQIGSGF
ncbi:MULTISPECIES: autotransporter domain-containing protein [unclassified Lysobacter]|uniref:autotransporter domain-containing protein n=1 Tax=unclassified Lysobacter TaxID=2635362 RepID=UPI001BE83D07|nr:MULTISPECIES: autotransporter domain-containing protein [unclassified Lysobacter]MBT2749143.1 autotransporter domain-containing protein [Lysobacter sp. ISL-42]MBT2753263.1 autotransporter domain-containing protein [Lysobacter sp. ISL-50]MBT2776562.1 autotransporter domain-containing protein [Lysobacter sp. ISL-54]MBT2783279.1 autotransporter domain-containing protein [Lysobacter sp. ISL-52]